MAGAADPSGSLILDCEGFSRLVRMDSEVVAFAEAARKNEIRVVCSTATLIEAYHDRLKPGAVGFARSRIVVEPVTEGLAAFATDLLRQAGVHGHSNAIDAMVAATALSQTPPATMLTSDPSDMQRLCGPRVHVVALS